MDNLLKVENIKLESFPHLKEISFDVNKSEIIGIFCKIDNGQEQIIDSICGIKKIKEGKISIVKNFYAIHHDSAIYEDLTVEENIQFTKDIYGTSIDIAEILEMTALLKYRNIPVGKLPIPLKKMTHFACVLSTDFELLILEEPSMSFDDDSNQKLIELSKILKNQGKGIAIFTAKKIDLNYCDRVYYIETLEGVN